MKKIVFIVPWFGKFRDDFYFWLESVRYNKTIDFLFFTDQELEFVPSNMRVIKADLKYIESLAKKYIWDGCIISKPYKVCDYKCAYGEMFQDYIKDYDFWGHCDVDLIFGDIRKFINNEILNRYDRIGVDGPFTLYRNNKDVNGIYRRVDNIHKIFTDQRPWGFDEWGLKNNGTASYWLDNLKEKTWCEKVFDNLAPYHYSFVSGTVKKYNLKIRNVIFLFENGHVYRVGTRGGKVIKTESLYVHIQKRQIYIETPPSSRFLIVPPGKYISYKGDITYFWLRLNVRDGDIWAYYTRLRNKINRLIGAKEWSNTVLRPSEDM